MADPVQITTTQVGNQASVTIQGKESGAEAPVTQAPPKPTEERPAWLPSKFKSAEDLAKSYTELEKKLGSGEPKKQAETPVEQKTEKPSALEIEATKAVTKAGLDMKALEAEVIAKGELSPESLKKLEESGITKDQIDVYKRGMEAQRQDYEAKILEGIEGGRESLDEALAWAADNLSPEEQDSFNKAVSLGDPHIGKLAVQGLLSQFREADGPRLVTGERAADGGDVFESHAQISEAQSDPRYENDPAYRAKIEAKIIRSDYSKFRH